jgi:hypothetical protein
VIEEKLIADEAVEQIQVAKYVDQNHVVTTNNSRQLVASNPGDFLSMAVQRGASIEELKILMDLKDRYDATEAKKAYVAAMAEFKRNAPKIGKDAHVEHSGISYNHATLGNICNVVIPALAEYGISHNWSQIQPGNGMIQVTCTLTHSLGHSESNTMEAPPDNTGKKNAIQSLSSTVTYLQRYTFLAACGLSTSEIDDDGRASESVEQEKEPEIVKKTLSGKSFEKAVTAVKSGTYSASDINKYYTLTTDQQIMLDDEIKKLKVTK